MNYIIVRTVKEKKGGFSSKPPLERSHYAMSILFGFDSSALGRATSRTPSL